MPKTVLVIVESPYAPKADTPRDANVELARNLAYVRACMHDCFMRGEVPFASHALYTQPGVLDDTIPQQRKQGIQAGFRVAAAFLTAAAMSPDYFEMKRVFYTDRGPMSPGMAKGYDDALAGGQIVEIRTLVPAGAPNLWLRTRDRSYKVDVDGIPYDPR